MSRVVVDTSVLIRYLIKPNPVIQYFIEEMWLNDEFVMVTSPELLAELEDVLSRDYIQTFVRPEEGEILLDVIRVKAEIVPPLVEIPIYTRDPKDDKFVACAIAGQATYIVTLDKDILALENLENVQMKTPHDFVASWRSKW